MLDLHRSYKEDQTDGLIILPSGETIKTIELPNKNNQVNASCIPTGQYKISRDHTGKHQYFKVNNVTGRTFIEIHLATKPSQLLGCIGIYKNSDINKLIELFGENDWYLNISENEDMYNACLAISK